MGVSRRQRLQGRVRGGPQLAALYLLTPVVAEHAAPGTPVGTILGLTAGSTLALIGDAGGRFVLAGGGVAAGAVATDHAAATSHAITLRETRAGYADSPRDTVIVIAVSAAVGTAATYLTADNGDRLIDDTSNPLMLEAA